MLSRWQVSTNQSSEGDRLAPVGGGQMVLPLLLSERCAGVLSSRVRVLAIIATHVIIQACVSISERQDKSQVVSQFLVLIGLPAACMVALAAICPVDTPSSGAPYIATLFVLWSLCSLFNAAKASGAGTAEGAIRALISLVAAATLCWLGFSMHRRNGCVALHSHRNRYLERGAHGGNRADARGRGGRRLPLGMNSVTPARRVPEGQRRASPIRQGPSASR